MEIKTKGLMLTLNILLMMQMTKPLASLITIISVGKLIHARCRSTTLNMDQNVNLILRDNRLLRPFRTLIRKRQKVNCSDKKVDKIFRQHSPKLRCGSRLIKARMQSQTI
jgi:hypothetical protein